MEDMMENEIVYGSGEESVQGVMSERVQSLASSIYREFEKMIKLYDEDVVKELMPLVVSLLEGLDQEVAENQESKVELELLKDDNEQLITQYEREKQLRRQAEQKYLEYEDVNDQEKRALQNRLEAVEMNQKQQTLKLKNFNDQISRHEYRELDMKKEYQALQKRHNEVLQKYMEYVDRLKLMGHNDTQGTPRLKLNVLRQTSSEFIDDGPESLTQDLNDHHSLSTPTTPVKELPGGGRRPNNATLQQEMISSSTSPDNSIGTSTGVQTNTETQATVDTVDTETVMTPIDNRNLSPQMAEFVNESPEIFGDGGKAERPSHLPNLQSFQQPAIFDELGAENAAELDDSFNITVDPSEFSDDDSDSTFEGLSTPLTGMGKEVENILMENSELRATKNALSVVKDDLIAKVDQLTAEAELTKQELYSIQTSKNKQNQRIAELESEVKKTREESEKLREVEEDDGVPMAQRKRFTRVEMARVLMERNQYKERLMELQEAVRWTEMIRASREHPSFEGKKSRSSIWKLFSSLFSSNTAPARRPVPQGNVRFNAPGGNVKPHGKQRTATVASLEKNTKVFDFLDDGPGQRARIRQDQYSKVKAHVRKDDGRVQAYGWSLPAKNPSPSKNTNQQSEASKTPLMGVPVPIYCRPLFEKEAGTKIWCAAGVNLNGGRTRDGGSIVGASVFYSSSMEDSEGAEGMKDNSELEKLDDDITQQQLQNEKSRRNHLSSYVWILTSNQNSSKVTVVDANLPQNILSTFSVSNANIISIASVPGAMESDYPSTENITATAESADDTTSVSSNDSSFGNVTLVSASIPATPGSSTPTSDRDLFSFKKVRKNWTLYFEELDEPSDFKAEVGEANIKRDITSVNEAEAMLAKAATAQALPDTLGMEGIVKESTLSKSDSGASSDADSSGDPLGATSQPIPTETIVSRQRSNNVELPSDLLKDGLSTAPEEADLMHEEADKKSTVMPTMWMGAQNGNLYIHSAVSNWKRCLHAIKLKDSILEIVHIKGRVMAALADGSVAVFHRSEDGLWDLNNYHLLDLGRPQHSLRCMTIARDKIWCGIRNKIHIINPQTLKVEKSFDAHPRKESQVRLMAWQGDGVWVSIRLDSTLRLYHVHTCKHLQDVDIEPYVSKMLGTGKLGFSFVRITSLLIACSRLWVGTSNGVIISIPLTETKKPIASGGSKPGGVIRVYSDNKSDSVRAGTTLPYCSITQAQLSFHGHRDNVKFFVAVPGALIVPIGQVTDPASAPDQITNRNMLVLSGGEGYVDFRAGDGEEDEDSSSSSSYGDGLANSSRAARSERSHLIVWQVSGVSE
ncbi:C-Jun-amino-terminal kinase-interacting protein 4-like isoform X3 [Apostichopus japonicus]|uniref:C-Jun-amino-terminal kinase-interacting protein 4-like isoform X3 n=1 Tax=Stichopus japonicus TaxID=307972 RepID=UPI003AB34504